MKLEVEVFSRSCPLNNPSVANMRTPAFILLLVEMLPFCMGAGSIYGGSRYLDITLFAAVDPDYVIKLKITYVVDVMKACFVDILFSISVFENVRIILCTHRTSWFLCSIGYFVVL